MTKPQLEAACDERGVVRVGLKNDGMKAALRQHYDHNTAAAAAPPTDCDEEVQAEYEVDEILDMRVVGRRRRALVQSLLGGLQRHYLGM